MGIESAFRVDGRVALVTGASRGLGRRFALALAEAGAKVVLAERTRADLEVVAAAIADAGGTAAVVELDVMQRASAVAAFEEAEARLGPVDILVNNSGIAVTKGVLEIDEADWRGVLDTNLTGAWFVAQEAARRMAGHGGGAIVNIASVLGFRTIGRTAAYSAAKAGLMHLTRAMAMELARHKVRVNAIAPGYIVTEMNRGFFETEGGQAIVRRVPQRRIGDPQDLDGALLLLCSDAGRYITGQTIVVDGGHSVAAI